MRVPTNVCFTTKKQLSAHCGFSGPQAASGAFEICYLFNDVFMELGWVYSTTSEYKSMMNLCHDRISHGRPLQIWLVLGSRKSVNGKLSETVRHSKELFCNYSLRDTINFCYCQEGMGILSRRGNTKFSKYMLGKWQ